MRRALALVAAAWVAALAGATPALASPQDVANDVADEIMSPYCDGVTLHDCVSPPAAKLRERILGWAEDGWSKERIIDHLTSDEQWGDIIRAAPPAKGTGLLAWILPGVALVAGLGALGFVARSWSRRRSVEPSPDPPSAEDKARLDQELTQLRNEA